MTSDIWSSRDLTSYMAVTAHYCVETPDGRLIIQSRLIAFRHVEGRHDGKSLAKIFVRILKELGIFNRVGMITLDNASNCASMMEYVAEMLQEMGIKFDKDGNRIRYCFIQRGYLRANNIYRCFPHVVNLSVKAGFKQLTVVPNSFDEHDSGDESDSEDEPMPLDSNLDDEYYSILKADVIGAARQLVTACRASGQRREDFEETIREGNAQDKFGGDKLRVVTLLRDMDVRWSSTYLMIDRVLLRC